MNNCFLKKQRKKKTEIGSCVRRMANESFEKCSKLLKAMPPFLQKEIRDMTTNADCYFNLRQFFVLCYSKQFRISLAELILFLTITNPNFTPFHAAQSDYGYRN